MFELANIEFLSVTKVIRFSVYPLMASSEVCFDLFPSFIGGFARFLPIVEHLTGTKTVQVTLQCARCFSSNSRKWNI